MNPSSDVNFVRLSVCAFSFWVVTSVAYIRVDKADIDLVIH